MMKLGTGDWMVCSRMDVHHGTQYRHNYTHTKCHTHTHIIKHSHTRTHTLDAHGHMILFVSVLIIYQYCRHVSDEWEEMCIVPVSESVSRALELDGFKKLLASLRLQPPTQQVCRVCRGCRERDVHEEREGWRFVRLARVEGGGV